MIKRAYAIQMSYEISDVEKTQAEKALIHFKHALKLLKLSDTHLNIMKTPFKDNPEMDPDSVMKIRAAIRRYRDKSVENFNEFKTQAFNCVNIVQEFGSDTQTAKLMKSFITSVEDLEKKVNKFVDLFKDLESKEFSKKVVESIESIQKQCDIIIEIVDERIIEHIQNNILSKNWVDSVSKDLQIKVQKKVPQILDLYNKRQEQLSNSIKGK